MRRVLVIGPGGAGKSTFARQLAARTSLPVVHLDALYWKTGWIESTREEWIETIDREVEAPEWIMDGNYGGTLDRRIGAADTVVFLDVPRWLCIWRVLKRRLRYHGRGRPDMAAGCQERLTWQFLSWIWSYETSRRPGILRRLEALDDSQRAIVLTSRSDVRRFPRSLAP